VADALLGEQDGVRHVRRLQSEGLVLLHRGHGRGQRAPLLRLLQ
jgi:hypothetical protein